MALGNYDPTQVIILLAGVIPVEYVAEGTFISASRDTNVFTTTISTDGQVYRTKVPDSTYTVEITLSSFSPTNGLLSKLSVADALAPVAVTFPLLIKDTSGSSLFFSTDSWVETTPTMAFGTTDTNRVWKIKCNGAGVYYGDNKNSSEQEIESILTTALPILKGFL